MVTETRQNTTQRANKLSTKNKIFQSKILPVLTEVDVLVAHGVVEAGAGVGAAEPEDQVERKEEGRPARTEPTCEERSNKLRIIIYLKWTSIKLSPSTHYLPNSSFLSFY